MIFFKIIIHLTAAYDRMKAAMGHIRAIIELLETVPEIDPEEL